MTGEVQRGGEGGEKVAGRGRDRHPAEGGTDEQAGCSGGWGQVWWRQRVGVTRAAAGGARGAGASGESLGRGRPGSRERGKDASGGDRMPTSAGVPR